ncbi:MAG TPA: hypothetical protein V6D22_07570 [Candidatus Obscuribacterales bacterium]
MRIPLIFIPLTATVGAMIYAAFHEPFLMVIAGAIGYVVMFPGGIAVNEFRAKRIRRHPFAKLPYDEFKALCLANADAPVSHYDSVLAGNCNPGTYGFTRRTFKGRRSITLGELLPYCRSGARVKNVALYVLIRQSKSSALQPTPKEVAL